MEFTISSIVYFINCLLYIFHVSKIYNKFSLAKAVWLPSLSLKIKGEGSIACASKPKG